MARTTVHEIGHWLGLRHIWGDAICGDDRIADTPPQLDKNFGCPSFPHRPNNTCGSDANGEMYMNYMDYVDDGCMTSFSKGQVKVMQEVMNTERFELSRSDKCDASVGINTPENSKKYFHIINNINEGNYNINLSPEIYNTPMLVYITDIRGKVVYTKNESYSTAINIDISNESEGMYFIHLKHKNFEATSKVMKTN
jgi:hypothetical protein